MIIHRTAVEASEVTADPAVLSDRYGSRERKKIAQIRNAIELVRGQSGESRGV
jgi:hypothetical protein